MAGRRQRSKKLLRFLFVLRNLCLYICYFASQAFNVLLLVQNLLLRYQQLMLIFVFGSDILRLCRLLLSTGEEQIYLIDDIIYLTAMPHLHLHQLELQVKYVL